MVPLPPAVPSCCLRPHGCKFRKSICLAVHKHDLALQCVCQVWWMVVYCLRISNSRDSGQHSTSLCIAQAKLISSGKLTTDSTPYKFTSYDALNYAAHHHLFTGKDVLLLCRLQYMCWIMEGTCLKHFERDNLWASSVLSCTVENTFYFIIFGHAGYCIFI